MATGVGAWRGPDGPIRTVRGADYAFDERFATMG
jgi:hypothetical protein